MKKNYSKAFFAAIAALGLATTAAAQPTYHVTEIPSAPGAACIGTAINDAGVVAGSCLPVNGVAASAANRGIAIWRNGVPTVLGALAGANDFAANALSSTGVVVGSSDATSNPRPQAVMSAAGGFLNIDPVNGGNARAIGIMDNGVIFGNLTKSLSGNTASWQVMMWTQDKGHPDRYRETSFPKLIAGDAKFAGIYALGSNKAGQVVGWVTNQVIGQRGAFWNNDDKHTIVALDTLPGGSHSIAWGVNDLGQAVGESNGPGYVTRATLWQNDAAHTPVDLGALPGDNESTAMFANSAGQVIGFSATGTFPTFAATRAFLWQNGRMFELGSLIDPADGAWTITGLFGMNNAGQILGIGTLGSRFATIVLTPAAQ